MSWTRTKATGSGQLYFRLQIEGFPYEAVTSADMTGTAADGRKRYAGLRSDGFKLRERVDLARAQWSPEGFRAVIADVNRQWTEAFRIPTAVTYLAADCTAGAATATVKATGSFTTTDTLWLDTEALTYTAANTAGTIFQGLGRGKLNTLAQKHYTVDGENQRYPEVTNWPRVREGRRVYLYVYGAGDNRQDSASNAGTLLWTGVVSTEPTFNGLEWEFSVDPISRKWDQDIGGDLADPLPIRGIYYPALSPLSVGVIEYSTATPFASHAAWTGFTIAGFWETQEAFCAALTTELATQMASPEVGAFTQTVLAVPIGESWGFEFDSAATPHAMAIYAESATDFVGTEGGAVVNVATGVRVEEVAASTRYRVTQSSQLGLVPRTTRAQFTGYLNDPWDLRLAASRRVNNDTATYPPWRLYLGGTAGITASVQAVAVEWESNGNADVAAGNTTPFIASVIGSSASDRYIDISSPIPRDQPQWYCASGSVVDVRLSRTHATGHLGTFIDAMTSDTAEFLNTGAMPDIRAADFTAMASTDIPDAAADNPLAGNRIFSLFAPVSFAELLEQECRLLGVFPAYASDGTVTFHRLRLPSQGEVGTTIVSADIVNGDGEWLSYEVAPLGMFSTVELSTYYKASEETHTGRPERARDSEAHGRSPDARTLEIRPYSRENGPINPADVIQLASRVLGTFGGTYAYLTIAVKLTLIDTLVGDVVDITYDKVPNSDGTFGVTNKIGIVVAREWDIRAARGKLTILVTDQKVGGYTVASKLSGLSGTSGTTGPFTANCSADYFPGSVQAADVWDVGDKIRLYRWDSTSTTNNETGELTSITGNSITFTTDGAWTHTGATWCAGSQVSTSITSANQKQYAYIANADGTLDFSGDTGNQAFTLA